MTNRYIIPMTTTGASDPRPTNHRQDPFSLSFSIELNGATATYAIEHTYDDVQAAGYDPTASSSKWYGQTNFTAATVDGEGVITSPCTAIRVNVASGGGAGAKCIVTQAGW